MSSFFIILFVLENVINIAESVSTRADAYEQYKRDAKMKDKKRCSTDYRPQYDSHQYIKDCSARPEIEKCDIDRFHYDDEVGPGRIYKLTDCHNSPRSRRSSRY
ncbi:uncharacterized protein MONOS_10857 [Monocercomonoides exilis]|uniref:uncharacterized protein n=1 Tax=Monocercomonoides exilis TaxID=2049356 RepID=UPI00355A5D48|nr:hypothetical protein MONOS_10857 [Monocercomonoides exilis]|eukprot:MONOS_10857.1-p1 / transcript=MONOS_10857.1 / gene=MONOS_10857 / organism=Monocercomonoides_exilis_PA203 / gene_product=unspecified product / transcript_product=unspecified product / location=Mono_scaffold00511:43817-44290(+) / protein_length=104 / sequence_SO=supercontig / SO=protein_coding / is_pseudo=false